MLGRMNSKCCLCATWFKVCGGSKILFALNLPPHPPWMLLVGFLRIFARALK